MRFSVAATAAFVGAAAAQYGNSTTTAAPVYVTEVVTAYTTYCPSATEITHGGVTYTVTEATTLTITNCPCTITKPVASSVVTSCVSSATPVYTPPVVYSSGVAPYNNATTKASTAVYPVGTGSSQTTAAPSGFTGAANKAFAASGAGLAAVMGFVAYVL